MGVIHTILRGVEKQVLRGLGKGHGTKSILTEIRGIRGLLAGDVTLCVDIGGNVGNYTAALLDVFPDAKVVTFEPSATNLAKLRERFGAEARVSLVPAAVSQLDGEATLYADTPGSGLGSLSKRDLDHLNIGFECAETVQTIRFETFWKTALDSQKIDILKLDIEGHEMDALTGAGAALAQTRAIQFEFGGSNIDTRTYFKDFWAFFRDHGFDLHRITPFGTLPVTKYSERDECFTTTNYIAIAQGQGR
ncbi:MAG: FkbM family methyltransferase [Aestuariivita sp.]|uniref:FkbM family methyltransferase n=1 Tax=Aestuariivita sp. TaxID=1872407 RepID=UPI003BB0E10B